jgi:hypothetical protein
MEFRERYDYPQFQEFHEYLAKKVRKIVEQQHPQYLGVLKTREKVASNP